jgi:hypothetical protein
VWRNHTDAQIGVDPVRAVLTIDTRERAHALAALIRGDNLHRIAELWGEPEFEALLPSLATALEPPPVSIPSRIVVDGMTQSSVAIADGLRAAGHHATVASHTGTECGGTPDLAILTSSFTVSPLDYQKWMAADVPHLPVILGERTVTVGPIILPGRTACVSCIERHRTDADEAWTVIGPQIWGRTSTLDNTRMATHVTAEILRLMSHDVGAMVNIDGPSLRRTDGNVERHPLCVCAEIPVTTAPGTDWGIAEMN